MKHTKGGVRLGMILLFMFSAGRLLPAAQSSSPSANPNPCNQKIAFAKESLEAPSGRAANQLVLARSLRLCGNYSQAISYYRQYLQSHPGNADGQVGLGEALADTGQYQAALSRFNQVLKKQPGYYDALQGKAYVLFWEGDFDRARAIFEALEKRNPHGPQNAQAIKDIARAQEAAHWKALRPGAGASPQAWIAFYRKRLASYPNDREAMKGLAGMEIRLKEYDAARQTLYRLLEANPGNRIARLEVARIDVDQRHYKAALQNYDVLLRQNSQDPAALLGKARIDFYKGKLPEAQAAATKALRVHPKDFSSLFLLASIQHARHHRRKALGLLSLAEKLSPGNSQVASLRNRVLSESSVTLRTTVAFAREIGPPSEFAGHGGLANEDLRTYTYGTTIGINLLPRTDSYISFTSIPTDSPPGPERDKFGNQIPTGITGATAPYEFLYRQSTRIGRRVTLRAGAGFVRFGPGEMVSVPGQPSAVRAAQQRPIGLAGVSLRLIHGLSFDLDATRSALPYTPVSTRLGVIQDRLQGRINYFFNSRTQLHWAYWYGRYSSENYTHTAVVNGTIESITQADHELAQGERITFERNVLRSERFSLDAGYEGLLYGVAGRGLAVYLGFFNPSFYQSHEFVPRIYGRLWGPLGYDFHAGIGIQQVGHRQAITRALSASPGISVRVSRHLRLILGYTHYNTAQILGPLRGNEVRFDTEWQY
ncbi:MAG: tetratricopeptide repeat protein [Acidobacteriota bacterium]